MRRRKGLPILAGVSLTAISLAALGGWLVRSSPVEPASPPVVGSSPIATPSSAVAGPPSPEPPSPSRIAAAVAETPPEIAGLSPASSISGPRIVDRLSRSERVADAPTLLQACWTADQLRGATDDRRAEKTASDHPLSARAPLPAVSLPDELRRSIRSVKPRNGEKLVALTFDLCERSRGISGYDAALVDYLRDQRVKATFFAGGKWMRSHPDRTMQLMADPLFELGNHTWTHANLRMADGPEMHDQIARTQVEYGALRERLLGSKCAGAWGDQAVGNVPARLALFRFPYGACDARALAAVNQSGLAAIQWSVVTGDPDKRQTAQAIARTVLSQVRPGSIVIAHANGRGWHTAEALPLIVPELRARGYRFVTVSELLARGEVVAADSCYELKPGDNLRYDRRSRASGKR